MAQLLWIRRTTFGSEDGPRPDYGKQESERHLIVQNEYDTLNDEIQIIIKASHNMLLLGDFNAKITVKGYQNNSRNGQLLNHLVEDQGLMVVNDTSKCSGIWSRQHQHNSNQKSILDYVICNKSMMQNIVEMEVHDTGCHKLKSSKSQ